jgi:PAS domain S-box-containing protein
MTSEMANQPKESAAKEIKVEMSDAKAVNVPLSAGGDRCLIEAVRDPMVTLTLDGKITYANAAMEMATGFARPEITGADWAGYFSSPLEARAAQQRARGGGFIPDCPLELVHRDGHRIPVLCNLTVQRDAAGKPAGLIAVARNLTALKRAEEELQRLKDYLENKVAERTARLESTNKELEAFAYSAAHDLRAPLRSVNNFSQKLLGSHAQQLDATGRAAVENIIGAARRMNELIDDLLKLSSVSRHELQRAPVNLSLLAETVLGELQKAEPERRVRLVVAPGLVAPADARMMRIVFENLLSNAWKFVAGQSSAEIEFGVIEGRGVRAFFVRDNGVGFSMEYAQRLFGAFERLHPPGEFPGTGIGLAIVQRIIHRHGGRVWAESRVSRGAAFYFTLPELAA